MFETADRSNFVVANASAVAATVPPDVVAIDFNSSLSGGKLTATEPDSATHATPFHRCDKRAGKVGLK